MTALSEKNKTALSGKYAAYPEYKDSGIEWLGDIPSVWKLCRLKFMATIKNGQDYKAVQADEGYPVMGSGGQFTYASEFMYDRESVLLGRKGTIDKPLYINEPFWTVDTMYYTEVNKDIHVKYLHYLALTIQFGRYSTNTALPSMTQEHLGNFTFAIPDNETDREQIANFLDYETAKIDTLIDKQQQLIKLLKEKRQAVISHAVTKGLNPKAAMCDSGVEWLGEVPEHWDVAKVKYFASIQGGYAFSSDSFQESGVQLLRIGNVYLNRLALERQPIFVDESFVKSHKNFSVRRGDILMSLTGTLGKTDYGFAVHVDEEGPFMLNQRVAKITPVESKIAPEYLIYAIRSESYLKQLYSLPSGTKQANLSNDDVINIPIVVPPTIEEQQLVARYISDNLQKYNHLIKKSEAAIQLIQERRTALISAAVTGKIDVRNWVQPAAS